MAGAPALFRSLESGLPRGAKAWQGKGHGGDHSEFTVGGFLLASPDGKQLLRVELCGLHVAPLGQCRPFLVPRRAASGAVEMGDVVRVHLDLAAFALDDDGVVAE